MYGIIPFARLFHIVLQAPAGAEGFDLGGGDPANAPPPGDFDPNADRGDDFDPTLFDETDPEPPIEKPKGEKEPKKPAEEPKPEPKDGEDPEKVEDGQPEAEKKPDDKPAEKKPSRAQERIKQLAERNAALERQLAQKVGSEEAAQTVADLETEVGKLDKEYHKALAEDPEKAGEIMGQIRKLERQIARVEAQAEADAAAEARFEMRDLNATIDELTSKHPQLDKGHEEYDRELTEEVNAIFNGLSTKMSKSAALKRAVALVMGETSREEKPAGLGDLNKQEEKREERRQEGVKRTVEAVKGQPKKTDEAGAAKPVEPKSFSTIKDIAKATEEELAKARGDEL